MRTNKHAAKLTNKQTDAAKTKQLALSFSTGVARHPRAARNGIVGCCVLRVAYSLATAHPLLCLVNGDDSAVFRFLSLVTLTFDL